MLIRSWRKSDYTIGKLYVNGSFLCCTLEPTDRHLFQGQPLEKMLSIKVKGKTAIPTGTYRIRVTESPKFKRELIELVDVPAFNGIRLHRGNTVQDTEGCILPGENSAVGKVTNSTKFEETLTALIKNENEAYITIV